MSRDAFADAEAEAVSDTKILELEQAFDFSQAVRRLYGVHIVFGDENCLDERYYKTLTLEDLQVTLEEVEGLTPQEWRDKLKTLDLEQLRCDAGVLRCADLYPAFDADKYTQYMGKRQAENDDVFLKQHSLVVSDPDLLEDVEFTKSYLETELRVCELLRKFPHPNLAKYLGCRVQAGRVTGIYYERFNVYLQEPRKKRVPVVRYIDEIRKGLDHLHSLGFCHNDMSPYNVMLKDDDTAVIIDFDGCLPAGEETIKEACTGFSRDLGVSEEENDWFGLQRIEGWMHEWNESMMQKQNVEHDEKLEDGD